MENGKPQERVSAQELREMVAEANRCLNCKDPKCKEGCPIANDIPEFIMALGRGDVGEARAVIARKSNLPAVCGRVCAKELQCEGHCILNKTGKPVRVGALERVIADFAYEMALPLEKVPQKTRGHVAVIGSGPAGLTVAGDLAKLGFDATVFEALEEPGGVLLYGIPAFRLPKEIVRREIENLKTLGVRFVTSCVVGPDITVDDLLAQSYDAVFIGSGTAVSNDLELPGRELEGVYQSAYLLRMDYLYGSRQTRRQELPVRAGDKVLVIGAGNVGLDAARTAKRLGAESVTVLARGREEEMTALDTGVEAARKEGVRFAFEMSSKAFLGEGGHLRALLAETPEGERELAADRVFLAVGSHPASRIVSTTTGISVDKDGYVMTKKRPYGMTTRRAVFAGGDVVHHPASVVLAMKQAKRVAVGIAEFVDAVKLLELT